MPICSECLKESSGPFPVITMPHYFTMQIYELRGKNLLPGNHEIFEPSKLELCKDCFNIVDDNILEEKAKKFLKARSSAAGNNASTVKTERTEPSEGDQKSQKPGGHKRPQTQTPAIIVSSSEGEAGEDEGVPAETNRPGPSSQPARPKAKKNSANVAENLGLGHSQPVGVLQKGSGQKGPDSAKEKHTSTNNAGKRRKAATATQTALSSEDEDDDGDTLPLRKKRRRRRAGFSELDDTAPATEDNEEENQNGGRNGVEDRTDADSYENDRNGVVESRNEDQTSTNGNIIGDNSSSTGTGTDSVGGTGLKVIPFIRHAYDINQSQSSKAKKAKEGIINMMFEYYNGQIENFPPVSSTASSWMEKTGPKRGYPKPSKILQILTPLTSGSDTGWSQDHLLPSMKLDLTQEQELALVLGFGTEITYEYLSARQKGSKLCEMKGEMLFNIPENVPLMLTFSSGVISQLDDLGEAREMENSEFPLVSGYAIPKIRGITIKTFEFTEEINLKYGKGTKVNAANCAEILNIASDEIDNVVAILVFFTEDYADKKKLIGTLTSSLFRFIRRRPKVAVAGGLHYKNIIFKNNGLRKEENKPVAMGIVIIGDPSVVRAAAVNLPGPADKNIKKIHEKQQPWNISSNNVTDLKNMQKFCEFENGGSFAFQIACAQRGFKMHKILHKEASLFKSVFPNTPLVGGFQGGDLIHEFKPWKRMEKQQYEIPNKEEDLEPLYSTSFLVVFHA